MPGSCPSSERLAAALRRPHSSEDDAELVAHLEACPACRTRLEELAGGTRWLEGKAKAGIGLKTPTPGHLQRAMRELESPVSADDREATAAPRLDFLGPADEPGTIGRFGPYQVLSHIASGGMGIVLKAHDPALNRVVALKILPPTVAANPLARARFVREARAAAAVVNEHVVPIYAVDESGGLPYIVMQFVQGRPLSERIRATGPLRLEEVLRIGAQTAAGLAAAHSQGLTHRDVKPGNILLENSVERAKLTDFGLARAVDDAGLTRTGELAGTPEFMSPEQASNETVDHRSDLFSLGTVIYAMATGISPFRASSVIAAVRKVCDERPPAAHLVNANVPDWLSAIIARLMAKSPADRFQSAREVCALLEQYLARVQQGELGGLPEAVTAKRKTSADSRQRKRLWVVASTLAIAGSLIVAPRIWHSSNTASKPVSSHPAFVVTDPRGKTLGSYPTLDAAVRGAPAAAVIDLCWNGPMVLSPVELGTKSLTLRAGKGFHPVCQCTDEGVPVIQTQSELTLENLEFEVLSHRVGEIGSTPASGNPLRMPDNRPDSPMPRSTSNGGSAVIASHHAPLRVSHCLFHRQLAPQSVMRRLTVIELDDSPACVIRDSALNAIIGRCIVWHQDSVANADSSAKANYQTSLVLSNSAFFGLSTVWLELGGGVNARSEITRCTFRGRTAFDFPSAFAATRWSVSARNNIIAAGSFLYDERVTPAKVPGDWLEWSGKTNFFDIHRGFFVGQDNAHDIPNRLDDWVRTWGTKVTECRSGNVTFGARQPHPDSSDGGTPRLKVFEVTNIAVLEGPPLTQGQWPTVGADTRMMGPDLP